MKNTKIIILILAIVFIFLVFSFVEAQSIPAKNDVKEEQLNKAITRIDTLEKLINNDAKVEQLNTAIAKIDTLEKKLNKLEKIKTENTWSKNINLIATIVSALGGLILTVITFFYLLATRKMVIEMRKQRELLEEPVISIKIVPDSQDGVILKLLMKNTGGSPAYDISVEFEPDLPYHTTTLNQLKMFKKLPLLDKNETIEFFFDSAIEYFQKNNPKFTVAKITYYKSPQIVNKTQKEPNIRYIEIDLEERDDHLQLATRNFTDLVNEIEELKHSLIFFAKEITLQKGNENDKRNFRKRKITKRTI